MTLLVWGRGLLIWGTIGALASLAPHLLISLLAPGIGGMLEIMAILLLFSVLPLAVFTAVVGAILLAIALLRRLGAN